MIFYNNEMHPALNYNSVELLLTDLDVALNLIQMGEVSRLPDTKALILKNAHVAYDTVRRFLVKVRPTAQQQREINDKLSRLAKSLAIAGELSAGGDLRTAS